MANDTTPSRAEIRRMQQKRRKRKPLTARERLSQQVQQGTVKRSKPKPKQPGGRDMSLLDEAARRLTR